MQQKKKLEIRIRNGRQADNLEVMLLSDQGDGLLGTRFDHAFERLRVAVEEKEHK